MIRSMRNRLSHRLHIARTTIFVVTLLSVFTDGARSYTFDELSKEYVHSSPSLNTRRGVWRGSAVASSFPTTLSRTSIIWRRGGGYADEYDEYDYDPLPRSRRSHAPRSQPRSRGRAVPPRHRPRKQQPSALDRTSKLAKQTLNLATSTTLSTLKGTGKAAYYLTAPKYVTRDEIYGVWRLDQVLLDDDTGRDTCAANVQLTRKGDVVTQYNQEKEERTVYHFRSRMWPICCTIEFEAKAFQGPGDRRPVSYYYKGAFRRKMADRSVIKIVGKIYQVKKGRFWKGGGAGVEVGSFVARRRITGSNARRQSHAAQEDDDYDVEDSDGYDDYYDISEEYDAGYGGEEEYDEEEA